MENMNDDLISRQDTIKYLMTNMNWYDEDGYESDDDYKRECITELISGVPPAQPESWEDEREKIADALSEKMAYMNTCLNERDIILGYLGVKRSNEIHCNSDCRNEKCENYHYATKELPSAQPERKKGKWIYHDDGYEDYFECSECGCTRDDKYRFCPNCGADMRGEENG